MSEPSGPIEKGTTYIVRPFIEPGKIALRVSRISPGSRQLLVGPASTSFSEQMKVRSSTRATSSGSERARELFGRLASESRSKVPASIRTCASSSYSSADPSHQWTESGWVKASISPTHSSSLELVVKAAGAVVESLIRLSLFDRFEAERRDVGLLVANFHKGRFPLFVGEGHFTGKRRAGVNLLTGWAIDVGD